MKKFDLALAEAGEPIEYFLDNKEWVSVHFVGQRRLGLFIIELKDCTILTYVEKESLRMAAKKKEMWVQLYSHDDFAHGIYVSSICDSKEKASNYTNILPGAHKNGEPQKIIVEID